jgi:hypothetical protein
MKTKITFLLLTLLCVSTIFSKNHCTHSDFKSCEIKLKAIPIGTSKIGGTDGKIILEVIGGAPHYSFTWSNGMKTKDIHNLEAGVYSVIVMDVHNCKKAIEVIIDCNVINSKPIVAVPTYPTIQGKNNQAIEKAGLLPFTPKAMEISEEEFNKIGGKYKVESPIASISYSDFQNENTPFEITRTYIIKDFCDNDTTVNQNIKIRDVRIPIQIPYPTMANFNYANITSWIFR